MEIKVTDLELKTCWDYQKAKLLLEWGGLDSSNGLTNEQRDELEKQVTLFLWVEIKKQFPAVEEFCTGKTGHFNIITERNHNTPIICIHGSFYMQLIGRNTRNAWRWESIDLEPYRFYFNEEGYFRGLVVDAINTQIIEGVNTKAAFSSLIAALNKQPVEEKQIILQTRGKEAGKTELISTPTRIV